MMGLLAMLKSVILAAALAAVTLGASACMAQPSGQAMVSVPAECFNMNLAPYSPPEKLDIGTGPKPAHFSVEIAANYNTREQGLMCRPTLADDQGMLFEFQDVDQRTFWMKDTLIGLDIIYIGADGRIVSIQKNAKPLDRTPLPSFGPATGVLEINAGLSDKLGLKPGDKVIHPFFQ